METLGEQIAKRIDEYLKVQKISLYALGKRAGLALSTLKNLYTKHTKSPSLALLYKICDGLGVTVNQFLDSPLFAPEVLNRIVLNS